jgi:hypothetical protein
MHDSWRCSKDSTCLMWARFTIATEIAHIMYARMWRVSERSFQSQSLVCAGFSWQDTDPLGHLHSDAWLFDPLLHGIASCEGGPLELKNLRVENVRQWRRLCFSVIHSLQIHLAQQIPFLSSVNHLFLWTIEKPWRSVSYNQRVTKSRWFFLWDWITWKDKPADNDVLGNLRLLLQLANKIDWWTFRPAKNPGKPGSIGFQAAWASKGCHQRWGSYMAMAPLGPSWRVKCSSWVDPSWLVAFRQCPNKGPNMNRFNTKGGFLRAVFTLQ